jgi:nucleoside-diphosphate-sugar epimerase
MKAILTGAEGNLGKRILEHAGFDCLPVSRGTWNRLNDIPHAQYQILIHCAYDLKNDVNERPDVVLESNVVSTGRALRVCREKSVSKFVFISSCSVYGGFTKLFNEELVKSFCIANGIEYLILRAFNSYGGDDEFSVVHKLVACAKQHRPFTLVNDGTAERDFIHVKDLARIVCNLAEMDVANEVVNVGSGRSVRIIDLVQAAEARFGPVALTRISKANEPVYSRANIDKVSKILSPQAMDVFDFIRDLV